MSSENPHLYRDGDIDLDDRMTQETKDFVREWLRQIKPSDLATLPLDVVRNGHDKEEKELIRTLKFDNLDAPKEIFIKNPNDGYDIPVSVFTPSDAAKNAPIVVFFHGGGWVFGSRQMYYHGVATLASKTRCVWASVEYRLAPEYKHRTQMSDYRAVIEWMNENRDKLSSKHAKLGVAGESAGGHIAAVMSHLYKPILDFQILVYPCVDLVTQYESYKEFASDCFLAVPSLMGFFINCYLEEPDMVKLPEVSPLFFNDFTGLPKCLILGAELDLFVESNKVYHEKIVASGSQSKLHVIKGTVHEFFSSGIGLKNAFDECAQQICEFMKNI